jgi:hypothetical protein
VSKLISSWFGIADSEAYGRKRGVIVDVEGCEHVVSVCTEVKR